MIKFSIGLQIAPEPGLMMPIYAAFAGTRESGVGGASGGALQAWRKPMWARFRTRLADGGGLDAGQLLSRLHRQGLRGRGGGGRWGREGLERERASYRLARGREILPPVPPKKGPVPPKMRAPCLHTLMAA